MQQTPFYECHIKAGGKIIDFCGFALPIHYGSQIKEHEIVRQNCGMFDVSHMSITDITGQEAKKFLRYMLSNDVEKLDKYSCDKAIYSALLNENAGIIDDLIVYKMPFGYRIISNSATREKVDKWITLQANNFNIIINKPQDLAMIAIQGPNSIINIAKIKTEISNQLLNLKSFESITHLNWCYARTGYTGENGLEIILPKKEAVKFWEQLIESGVSPCGLGARDTLRLEAGLNLYGHDMNENTLPCSCNMDFVIDLSDKNRNFIGKNKYLELKPLNSLHQVGLILEKNGILREGQEITINHTVLGKITSGTFSPTLKKSIAIAQIKIEDSTTNNEVFVNIRNNLQIVKIVKLPFVKNGKILHF